MTKIHLDTDIGGDMDDLCALAMLLKWDDLEITGITTTSEEGGRRAGYVRHVLTLMDRGDIPFAAGADLSEGYFRYDQLGYPNDEENWGEAVAPHPNPTDDAIELLKRSVEQGAILVGIGALTNFMLLDQKYPGILRDAPLYLMAGYVYDIPPEYPQFNKTDDWNFQLDIRAAQYVLEHADPTLIPLTMSCQTALTRSDLPRLAQAGRLGELLYRQAELFSKTEGFDQKYGQVYAGVLDDIINFHHDPLACAIALGWRNGIEIETVPLRFEVRDGYIYEIPDANGKPIRVVTKIDGNAFNRFWLDTVCG
jgi:inosine-uridine nucleoside N-ribohydrolase